MSKKSVLIIGSDGRAHALAELLSKSPRLGQMYFAPGNGGTWGMGINFPAPVDHIEELADFARLRKIDLNVVSPEVPLDLGIVNLFREKGLRIIGPTKEAARLETSKSWAKEFMRDHGIPTAAFLTFKRYDDAEAYTYGRGAPMVIKASGLAAGKGAYVCLTMNESHAALRAIMKDRAHGDAGNEVVIENYLHGPEVSFQVFVYGNGSYELFPVAQDYKPAGDGDTGPNTGGMGAIASCNLVSQELVAEVRHRIIEPTLWGMRDLGHEYTGFLYIQLKLTPEGPKVVEYNVRLGDPEAEVVLPLFDTELTDPVDFFYRAANIAMYGDDGQRMPEIVWHNGYAAAVVGAAHGYPGEYKRGMPVTGVDAAERVPGVTVYHAGTKLDDGGLVSSGGRVVTVSALGDTLDAAVQTAYRGIACINIGDSEIDYRTDIGCNASELLEVPVAAVQIH